MPKIRTLEASSTEVFVDVNDLIIELLRDLDKCSTEAEKKAYRHLVAKLTELRNKSHKY